MTKQEQQELRETARALDERQQKIVVSLVAAMIEHSDRVKDREWVGEQLARTIGLALEVAEDDELSSSREGVDRVEHYAREHAPILLRTAFGIFGQVALTLQRRGGEITGAAAMAEVVRYFADVDPPA